MPTIPHVEPVLYVAGDVHLRGDDSAFAIWLDALAAKPKARLVILGDLFEYWTDAPSAAERYRGTLAKLRALRERGWHIDLVRGNREAAAGRMLEVLSGATLHWPALDVRLGALRVRIVHGDRCCHDPAYHAYSAFITSFPVRVARMTAPAWLPEAIARGLRQISRNRQRAPMKKIPRAFIDPRRVTASARGADALIAGHIHAAWRKQIRGVDMLLVGDWPERSGHWIEGFADGRLIARDGHWPSDRSMPA